MQIIQDFRTLHAIPEPDNRLPKTTAYIRRCLQGLRCKIFSPTEGSVCAFFDFQKPATLAFRADTDALPVTEQTDLPWKSRHPGMMHACGHDGHTAILLELARRISRNSLSCNVLLIFQPAEETTGGAEAICKTGLLQAYKVQSIFALHLWPGLPAGELFSRPGYLMSRTRNVTVTFTGKSVHIAAEKSGADALQAACCFYCKAGQIRETAPHLLKFGTLHGGTVSNAVCGKAVLTGSLRTFQDRTDRHLTASLTMLCRQIAKQTRCQGDICFTPGYPPVINGPRLFKQVQKNCPVKILDRAFWTGEDFSFYQQQVSGIYFLLGIGDTPPLHSPYFSFDESILTAGADFFTALCSAAHTVIQ